MMLPTQISRADLVIVAFAITAAASDLRWRKIPRTLTVAGLMLGLGYHLLHGGKFEFAWAMLAALVGFALGLTFFYLGAIGGGDVKLITALGALLGFSRWLLAMEVAIFAAALIGLVQAVRRGLLRQTLLNVLATLRWVLSRGVQPHPVINVGNSAMLRAPFGVAAAVGTLIAVMKP
jgi:prepilin peptidase CpaA